VGPIILLERVASYGLGMGWGFGLMVKRQVANRKFNKKIIDTVMVVF
jgi:hypothetical protein